MRQKLTNRFLAGIMVVMLALFMGVGISAVPVLAASGNIYTCKITPCYSHPVTGVIEDSGGASSYATGQGMVEGAIYTTGMMEVTDSGEYYLTVRMSLVDYTSNHSFSVQNVGDSGWSSTAMGVTGTGTDTNGTTADVCIQVPSENCIVRGSMYVEPMGRNVIFYFYPSNYASGIVDSMHATMVTEASGANTVQEESVQESETVQESVQEEVAQTETVTSGTVQGAGSAQTPRLQSSLSGEAPAPVVSDGSAGSAELNSTKGLSLSTESSVNITDSNNTQTSVTEQAVVLATAITISGLILILVAALVVYYFRRNWRRWGGADDDDE